MAELQKPTNPWLVAVWPGMGNVALSAGYYLMAKLGMHGLAELSSVELFEMEHVEVKHGLIRPGKLPKSRFFLWSDPNGQRDIVVFIGEAQPPMGKYAFCNRLIEFAKRIGAERVFTFAAMATRMHPDRQSRVFGAAIDEASLEDLRRCDLEVLQDGHIAGLNGVLLGVAAEHSLSGACLLGELPHIFAQLPYPKAALAVLRTFAELANIEIDFAELEDQAAAVDEKLGEVLARVQETFEDSPFAPEDEEGFRAEPFDEGRLSKEEEQRIESLFQEAAGDRQKAYELKRELDRLDVFQDYEDRFLDLFSKPSE